MIPSEAINMAPTDVIVSGTTDDLRYDSSGSGVTFNHVQGKEPVIYIRVTPPNKTEPILISEIVVHGNVEDYSLGVLHPASGETLVWDSFYENLDTNAPLKFTPYKSFIGLAIRLNTPKSGTQFTGVMLEVIGCFGPGKILSSFNTVKFYNYLFHELHIFFS